MINNKNYITAKDLIIPNIKMVEQTVLRTIKDLSCHKYPTKVHKTVPKNDKTRSKGTKNILLLNIRPVTMKKVAVHLMYQVKSPLGVIFFKSFITIF